MSFVQEVPIRKSIEKPCYAKSNAFVRNIDFLKRDFTVIDFKLKEVPVFRHETYRITTEIFVKENENILSSKKGFVVPNQRVIFEVVEWE